MWLHAAYQLSLYHNSLCPLTHCSTKLHFKNSCFKVVPYFFTVKTVVTTLKRLFLDLRPSTDTIGSHDIPSVTSLTHL